ncbi:N-acetyl-alpha-D-glucosaminyl L-malate deacetylase 1 [subsurface metagenome]
MKEDKQKRIMVIGAHPDDADLLTAGLAIKLVANGHRVKFVSVTSGNAGHHKRSSAELAFIRKNEGERSAAALGVEYECLGVDDGHVWVNEENTRKMIKVIREFNPHLIITHRPYDYHRDHRYTGQLIMDASYMLIVPLFHPEFPPQTRDMPIIAYAYDDFAKPYRFEPNVFMNVTDLMEEKTKAITNHESQLYEWLP